MNNECMHKWIYKSEKGYTIANDSRYCELCRKTEYYANEWASLKELHNKPSYRLELWKEIYKKWGKKKK